MIKSTKSNNSTPLIYKSIVVAIEVTLSKVSREFRMFILVNNSIHISTNRQRLAMQTRNISNCNIKSLFQQFRSSTIFIIS